MKNKKAISFMMAALMLLLTAPAFAAGESGNSKLEISASCLIPELIVVTVPSDAQVLLNPYEIPVEINGAFIGYQILTEPVSIHNLSRVPISVSVSITGKIKENSDMTLTSMSTKGSTSTLKKAFIYFEIKATSDPDVVAWDNAYNAEKHIVVRTTAKSKKNIVTLDAGDETAPASSKCYGAFRLAGDCIAVPKTGWSEEDGVSAVVAFTFTLLPLS